MCVDRLFESGIGRQRLPHLHRELPVAPSSSAIPLPKLTRKLFIGRIDTRQARHLVEKSVVQLADGTGNRLSHASGRMIAPSFPTSSPRTATTTL